MKTFFIVLFLLVSFGLNAQISLVGANNYKRAQYLSGSKDELKNNIVKLNLTSLVFKTISLQYERVLNKKFSATLSVGFMPESSIPFKNVILNRYGTDSISEKVIENFKIGNFQITPEFRIYLSKKGYGHGFYIAPYYRYSKTTTKDLIFDYEEDGGTTNSVSLSGNLTSNSAGIMIGAQWLFKNNISLDWWILGLQYGKIKGTYTGISERNLTASEQSDLQDVINGVEIPMVDKEVDVFEDGAKLTLKGPFVGLRTGLSIGYRF